MSVPPSPHGSVPPPHGVPPGNDSGGYYGYPPQGWQQPAQPPHNPKRGNGWKWALGAVSFLAAIGVTAAVTMSVAGKRDEGAESRSGPSLPPNGVVSSDIASAADTGPVAVITDDPSCAAQSPILETFAAQQPKGWVDRDPAVLPDAWSPELRKQYEQVQGAMRSAADQFVPLTKVTPHRTMRELYEQFIAYSRAYADSIPTYTPRADYLARVSITAADAISRICAAVNYGSAAARGPLVPPIETPSENAPMQDPSNPDRFLENPNPVCTNWDSTLRQFQADTTAWLKTDPDIPASQWTPEQKAINDEVAPIMERLATRMNELGEQSANPTLQDFAALSAQYRLAYVKALPTYTPADKYLASTSIRLAAMINSACQAVS